MTSIGDIILSREKTAVLPEYPESDGQGIEPYFVVRSNRTAFTLADPPISDNVVVRGHNLSGAIRMTGVVIDQFMRDRTILRKEDPQGWSDAWEKMQSAYERRYTPEAWVTIHVNGQPYFSTIKDSRIDKIEKAAQGGEVDDRVVRQATNDIIGQAAAVAIEHDSQTALVMSETAKHIKCAILERTEGSTKSFSATIYKEGDKGVPVAPLLMLAADLVEAMNLSLFLDYVRILARENTITAPGVTPLRVRDAVQRHGELAELVTGYEKAHRIHYTPEKPRFLVPKV